MMMSSRTNSRTFPKSLGRRHQGGIRVVLVGVLLLHGWPTSCWVQSWGGSVVPVARRRQRQNGRRLGPLWNVPPPPQQEQGEQQEESSTNNKAPETLGFDDTDVASKGLVSSLTNLVNSWVNGSRTKNAFTTITSSSNSSSTLLDQLSPPPTSPEELLQRIRADYQEHNYLWTGHIDLPCFEEACRFQDPTLEFVGRLQFVENVQNLQPLVNNLIPAAHDKQSRLFSIQLHSENDAGGYIQTRWNMVGNFTNLFWKPQLNVVGRTKFWYRRQRQQDDSSPNNKDASSSSYAVYFYDEVWELPAYQALLQLLIPRW